MLTLRPARLTLAAIVFICILLLPAAIAAAQPPDPAALKAALWADPAGPRLPDFRQPPTAADAAAAGDALALADAGSRIVYQSYRDNNWEIYAQRGDGAGETRLTNNPSPDMEPRLNRDASRVAYSSQYRGARSIYTMNADGSNQNRITFPEEIYHIQPAWSPDGRRIAYASNEVGNYEIYVMNADGSGQTRLTIHSAADGRPFWSPDGGQIGWLRVGETDNVIWVMNADGSNPHAVTPALRFLSHPVWSPDGTKLGFDYDADGDFWSELAVLNLSDSRITTLYDLGGQLLDAWMGSFAPDGAGVVFSRVEYVIYNNELYLYHTYVERLSAGGARTRLTASGYDLYPDMQRWDYVPPASRLEPLSAWTRSNRVNLTIVGQDNSRIAGYDIQVKDGPAGAWADAFQNIAPNAPGMPTVAYAGQYGHAYSFRIRARDEAGNVEAWPAQPDAATTTYAWRISALVRDARGRPAPLADVILDPPAFYTLHADALGRAAAYSADLGGEGRAAHAGYGRSTFTYANVDYDQENVVMHLRPLDDLLINGNFEAENLSGWTTVGHVQLMNSSGYPHVPALGTEAAQMGQAWAFGTPTGVSDPARNACCAAAAAGREGALHAVWKDHWMGDRFWYAWRNPAGVWSAPAIIPNAHFTTFAGQQISVGPDGSAYVFWRDTGSPVHLVTRRPNGVWTAVEDLPTDGGEFSALVDQAGVIHATVRPGWPRQVLYMQRRPGEAWTTPVNLSGAHDVLFGPKLALGPDGTLFLAWASDEPRAVYLRWRAPAGAWSPEARVAPLQYDVSIAADGRGVLHVFSSCPAPNYPDQCYTQRLPDGSWTPIEMLWDSSDGQVGHALQVSPQGVAYVWWGYSVALRLSDGYWMRVRGVGVEGHTNLGMGLATVGETMHLIAPDTTGPEPSRVYHQTLAAAPAEIISSLAQRVTIPAGAHAPTLAFDYRLLGAWAGAGLRVRVQPADDPTPTTAALLLSNQNYWTRADVGLDAWAGRSVTVSIEAYTPAGGQPVEVFLDEATLGSWWTPALGSIAPDFIPPRTPARITIRGENFAATPALYINQTTPLTDVEFVDEHTLRATLPANLPAGHYDLWITNPGGQMSANLGALRIAGWLYLPWVGK